MQKAVKFELIKKVGKYSRTECIFSQMFSSVYLSDTYKLMAPAVANSCSFLLSICLASDDPFRAAVCWSGRAAPFCNVLSVVPLRVDRLSSKKQRDDGMSS